MNTFEELHKERIKFIKQYNEKDHAIIKGNNCVLVSAPHGVNHVRLGKLKFKEIGSLTTALYLQKQTNCYLIAKTKNNNDDANFDNNCAYRNALKKLIRENNIKYMIDVHGLAEKRNIDVNLGIHLGKNIEANPIAFQQLNDALKNNNFTVSIDQPFMAGANTICGSMKNEFEKLFTIQIEINCGITNKKENTEKFQKLLKILSIWLNLLK